METHTHLIHYLFYCKFLTGENAGWRASSQYWVNTWVKPSQAELWYQQKCCCSKCRLKGCILPSSTVCKAVVSSLWLITYSVNCGSCGGRCSSVSQNSKEKKKRPFTNSSAASESRHGCFLYRWFSLFLVDFTSFWAFSQRGSFYFTE